MALKTFSEGLFVKRARENDLRSLQREIEKILKQNPDTRSTIQVANLAAEIKKAGALDADRHAVLVAVAKAAGQKVTWKKPKGASQLNRPPPKPQPPRPTPAPLVAAKRPSKEVVEFKKLADAKKWKELEKKVIPELQRNPNNIELIRLRGQIFEERKQWERALEWYEQANLGLKPGNERDSLVKDIYRTLIYVDGEEESKKYLKVLKRGVQDPAILKWIDATTK